MSSIKFSGLASGMDTDNIIKELMKAQRLGVDKIEKSKTKLEWKKDIWKDMNKKIYSFYTKHVFKLRSSGTFNQKNTTTSDDSISVTAGSTAPRGTHKIKVTKLAKGAYLNSKEVNEGYKIPVGSTAKFKISDGSKTVEIEMKSVDKDEKGINDFIEKINESGLNIKASYDSKFDRIFINTTTTGEKTKIEFSSLDANAETLFTKMGFTLDSDKVNLTGNIGQNGQDAVFDYNGVVGMKSSDNKVSINGLEVVFNSALNKDIDINVTQDTDAIYKSAKEFITQFNVMLTEINTKINAKSANGYDPLTSEEKKAMSDDDIKLWEGKIKDSLLKRDSVLSSLVDSMRNIVTLSTGVDNSKFTYKYISQLGIVTTDHKEKGLLHIEGDEDEPILSIKENKLKEAIETNPEKVAELFNAIGDKLYSTMQEKMKSTSISSALTFYNDKEIDDKLEEYEDRIFQLEERLYQVENRYYKQFTAMEQAIQRMNNQGNYLASMLGGGQ